MRVVIYSGWTKSGGSTEAFIELTNALNEAGIDTTFYGPHREHLTRCKSGLCFSLNDLKTVKATTLVSHFCLLPSRQTLPFEKVILSCHETNVYPLTETIVNPADLVHLVSKTQFDWHLDYSKTKFFFKPYNIIPNIIPKIELPKGINHMGQYAGVIGSIDRHKQTHVSIQRAIDDGYIPLLFGAVTDTEYYTTYVFPFIIKTQAFMMGIVERSKMYSSFSRVYHSSLRETFNYVKAECESIGMPYFGMMRNDPQVNYLSKEDVVKEWIKIV